MQNIDLIIHTGEKPFILFAKILIINGGWVRNRLIISLILQGRADYIMLLMKGDEQGMLDALHGLENTPTLTYLAIMHYQVRCAVWLLGINMGLAEGKNIQRKCHSYIITQEKSHFVC